MTTSAPETTRILELLRRHPFTRSFPETHLQRLAEIAYVRRWNPGDYLLREGRPVEAFYLILSGRVAVEVYQPDRGVIPLQTLGRGDAVGWSWMLPPYRATFDIRVLEPTETICFPAPELRQRMEEDPTLAVSLLSKLLSMVASRIQATRLQLLDMYHRENP